MRDIYRNPTIRALAADVGDQPAPSRPPDAPDRPVTRGSSVGHALCGTVQLLAFLAASYLGAVLLSAAFGWLSTAGDLPHLLGRAAVFTGATLAGLTVLPIAAKWLLVGRWRPTEIPLWSLGYLRFWAVKTLVRASPVAMFPGSPLFVLYLRALGAKIGRGATLLSPEVPVATDLLTVGAGAVVRKQSVLNGYRAVDGTIQIGAVTVGRDAYVGENSVLDVGTALGTGATLGHSSTLGAGQSVPDGQTWHGCPAEPAGTDYHTCPPARCGVPRRVVYSAAQLLTVLITGSLVLAAGVTTLTRVPALSALLVPGNGALSTGTFYLVAVCVAVAVFVGGTLGGLLILWLVPRLLAGLLPADRVYPLYGFHHVLQQLITGMTNLPFYNYLFGDSAAVLHYVRFLGYDLDGPVQTGSNFGTEFRHDSPFLSRVGTGTMTSDVLSMMNMDCSASSFRMCQVSVGRRNYLGNHIAFPPQARTGENCLLATKVMVPIDGPVRENVGLLGSPPFEIPRSVERDRRSDELDDPRVLARRLSGKNRHNTVTAALYLLAQGVQVLMATLVGAVALDLFGRFGPYGLAPVPVVMVLAGVGTSVVIERLSLGFGRLRPRYCSIYDPYFWSHERHCKLVVTPPFPGTPFNPLIWRLAGVRMGRRVFDDGCGMPEKTLVEIGDDAILNNGSVIQCHSLEDGSFKSDHTTLGAGATLGVRAFVHYGVTMGDGSTLDADSFLMKGEDVAPHEHWAGNPAEQSAREEVTAE